MNPLKIKASATPITSANFQGLQAMSDAEVKNYIANKITVGFAGAAGNGSNTADINIDTANALSGTAIGSFVDTDRNEATGTHPATGASTTVTYYAKQITATDNGTITNRMVGYDSAIKQLTDAQINTALDKVITSMVTEAEYTAGQYRLSGSAPSGGTWTSRYTITDVANGGNTTYYIWQKTAATSSPNAELVPLKTYSGNNVRQMSDAEIQEMVPYFRNRIISTGIGTYKLQASTPSPGTWVNMGSGSDTREQIGSENYTGTYGGTRTYSSVGYGGTRTYSSSYLNTFSGTRTYSTTYGGTRTYSTSYTSQFAGTRPFSGSRTYSANYTLFFGGFVGGNFAGSRTYSANYISATQFFTGGFSGSRTYSGNYSGSRTYSGTYANSFSGSRTYTGAYAGSRTYSGSYTGTYAGDTILATKDTVSTVSLWIRTA